MKNARSISASAIISLLVGVFSAGVAKANVIQLSALDLSAIQQNIETPQADKSAGGNPISIGGLKFDRGIGTNGTSKIIVLLDGNADRFTGSVGIDDDVKNQPGVRVAISVMVDGRYVFPTIRPGTRGNRGIEMRPNDLPQRLDIDLKGARILELNVQMNGPVVGAGRGSKAATAPADMYHVDWADAKISYANVKPQIVAPSRDELGILTPPASSKPRINGAKIFGVHPGHPVLFTIAVTGDRPMQFIADGLPAGLHLDSATGQISGSTTETGEHSVTLYAQNSQGTTDATLKIVVGDTINLTPQMGWNSWNCFGASVTAQNIKDAADMLVKSGLINHGWTYVNIDDCWENKPGSNQNAKSDLKLPSDPRSADGTINPNGRFADMKNLTDYIHHLGLRAGLYSSPGPLTCGGCTGSYQHEQQDVKTWDAWGFDYIKYDWCTYAKIVGDKIDVEARKLPYKIVGDAIKNADRDIVFSVCQYGDGNVWEWGSEVGGNSWRTSGDILEPNWESISLNGFYYSAGKEKYAGPAHWNDADMLVVGSVDIGAGKAIRPTALTPNEQFTHISLWSLIDSPLLLGCDLTRLDDFTLNLLSNDEVIAVNQDPLGKQAARVVQQGQFEVWAKDMADGSKAVGLFNRSEVEGKFAVKFSDLKITGEQNVRDLWRQKDLGKFTDQFEAVVPRHGVVLVKIGTARK